MDGQTGEFRGQIMSVGPASWPQGTHETAHMGSATVCRPLTASFGGAETMVCVVDTGRSVAAISVDRRPVRQLCRPRAERHLINGTAEWMELIMFKRARMHHASLSSAYPDVF